MGAWGALSSMKVDGSFLMNGSLVFEWGAGQLSIGNGGSMTVNGNGVFHINSTYVSNVLHTISGTGSLKVDAGQTLTLNSDLVVNGNFSVMGRLVVPAARTLQVNGVLSVKPG